MLLLTEKAIRYVQLAEFPSCFTQGFTMQVAIFCLTGNYKIILIASLNVFYSSYSRGQVKWYYQVSMQLRMLAEPN